MTLNDFVNLYISDGKGVYIYVFRYEDSFYNFIDGDNNYELVCTLHSSFISSEYLKPKIANTTVKNFSATRKNTLAVWIDTYDGSEVEE